MDANRVHFDYKMTDVLCMFLILFGRPGLVSSQDTAIPTATVHILPECTTVPREGDSVTLDCEISSLQSIDVVLWGRLSNLSDSQQFIVNVNGLTGYAGSRLSIISQLQVVNSTTALYSHKITINPLRQSDQGYYQCFVLRSPDIIAQSTDVYLLVHRRDEFPVCTPDGPATVTIGSSLLCKTLSETRMPLVSEIGMSTEAEGWIISPTNAEGSPGQELTRRVTNLEHGKSFHCFSISTVSGVTIGCDIGPLTVTNNLSTETPVNTTMIFTSDTPQNAGLSGADIAGIVIGVILLLIIIAVHTLCCRCNPKRWMYAKSYPFELGTSFRASRQLGSTGSALPDPELGNSEPQTNNLNSDSQVPTNENDTGITAFGSGLTENLHQPTPIPEPLTSEQPDPQSADPNSKPPPIYSQVQNKTTGTDTKEPTKPKPPAVYAQVNKTTPVTDSKEPTKPNPPAVYAQVNKPTPVTETSEPITPQSAINTEMDESSSQDDAELLKENGKDSSKLKNIKRFGQNRNGQVSRPPKPDPVVIYAELDLTERGNDEVHPPSDDSQTIYAQIRR
ncbi:uncharacterized protein [Asterias amurensis]|uniref:uncharacterized protein n=1 Tax=Asterias amurensis TaxID=7602 RepID=UPI003AB1B020